MKRENTLNTTIDAVALAAVLAQPWADVVLSGATTTSQLESNLQSLALNLDEHLTNLETALVESPKQYWRTRSALEWN